MNDKPRHERLKKLIELAIRLQRPHGMTLDEIQRDFEVKRRTAERMRATVADAFGELERVESWETKRRWRLRSTTVHHLILISPGELAELETAARAAETSSLEDRAKALRSIAEKVHAALRPESRRRVESDLGALVQAEGVAVQPGPRIRLPPQMIHSLREAIVGRRWATFKYFSQDGKMREPRVRPLGILYGRRPFLVASGEWGTVPWLWRLQNVRNIHVGDETFPDPDFDLADYASHSFGVYQEEPVDVVLRFGASVDADAADFLFHVNQTTETNADGSLTVRFRAGGMIEMCHHLFTWGDSVTIEQPKELREQLAKMAAQVAAHHGPPRPHPQA